MKVELKDKELLDINGGALSLGLIGGLIVGGAFIIGVIDGIFRPYPCRR